MDFEKLHIALEGLCEGVLVPSIQISQHAVADLFDREERRAVDAFTWTARMAVD